MYASHQYVTYKEISVHFLFNNVSMHLLRFAKQKMLNKLYYDISSKIIIAG